jgi:hypothetical protein
MKIWGQSTTAHDVTSTKIGRDVSPAPDRAALVAFDGVLNIGVP